MRTPEPCAPAAAAGGKMILRITGPRRESSSFALNGDRRTIGRAGDVDIVLDSGAVSRHHAELVKDPFERWWVRDLGSRNGTWVNGQKKTESLLSPGDVLQVGDFALTLAPEAGVADARATMTHLELPIVEGEAGHISRLSEVEVPKVSHEHLSAVVELGHVLNIMHDADERWRRLVELLLSDQFHGHGALILRVPRRQPERAQIVREPELAPEISAPPPISASVLRAIVENPEEPVLATNLSSGPDQVMLSMPADVMALTVIAVPLAHDEQVVDVLYVEMNPDCGQTDWLALVALAAKQYQQAESVWLNVDKMKQYAAVERELEKAQEIQQRLIPKDIVVPGVEVAVGFKPCHWVGGDYVDIVPTPDGRVLLAVADVCGKGLGAALVASCIHTMVHSAVRNGEGLAVLMAALNEYFCQYMGTQSFATMIGVMIDPRTGSCQSIGAGHPAGLIVNPRGDIRPLKLDGGTPLGIEPNPPAMVVDQIAPGEMLALFTDGLTELANESDEMLGEEGLSEGLRTLYAAGHQDALCDVAEHLGQCLDAFQGKSLARDDRSFLLVRLKGGPIR